MPDRLGNAALIWSATSDPNSERVHLLQAPLRSIKAGHSLQTFTRQSMDRSAFEHTSIGDGAQELSGTVRYDHDPKGLMDVLVAGSQGRTLTYIPDLSDPDVKFDCDLISPLTPTTLALDAQRGILGDQSVEIQLRLTDHGPFDPLYHGSAVLFSYRAGGSLAASSSFGRVTNSTAPATYADNSTGGGYGQGRTGITNVARIEWQAEQSSVGPRTLPTLLVEGERTNLLTESNDIDQWTDESPTADLTSEQSDPFGSTDGWLVDDSTTGTSVRAFAVTFPDAGPHMISMWLKEGTSPTTGFIRVNVRDVTAVADRLTANITFSSGEPTITMSVGEVVGPVERWKDGWWRFPMLGSSEVISGNVNRLRLFPAFSQSTDTGNVFFFGAQVE